MQDQYTYGIFTTEGEFIAGNFNHGQMNIAAMMDESTASLYLSTRNGTLLMGTAVNVQKEGYRPDTVIYLEESAYNPYLLRIDLSYVQDFYARVRRNLEQNGYKVRNLASDADFFSERSRQVTYMMPEGESDGVKANNTANYAAGRLLMGKDVIAVSKNLAKSVDFAVMVADKLASYMAAGFSIVVAKRTFRDADLMIVDTLYGDYEIDIDKNEIGMNAIYPEIYSDIGKFAQMQNVAAIFSGTETLTQITGKIVTEYGMRLSGINKIKFEKFLDSEKLRESYDQPITHEPEENVNENRDSDSKHNENGKKLQWVTTDPDKLNRDHEEEQKRKRHKELIMIAVVIVLLILIFAAVIFVAVDPLGLGLMKNFGHGGAEIHQITPSATIPPVQGNIILTVSGKTTINIPSGCDIIDSSRKSIGYVDM